MNTINILKITFAIGKNFALLSNRLSSPLASATSPVSSSFSFNKVGNSSFICFSWHVILKCCSLDGEKDMGNKIQEIDKGLIKVKVLTTYKYVNKQLVTKNSELSLFRLLQITKSVSNSISKIYFYWHTSKSIILELLSLFRKKSLASFKALFWSSLSSLMYLPNWSFRAKIPLFLLLSSSCCSCFISALLFLAVSNKTEIKNQVQ